MLKGYPMKHYAKVLAVCVLVSGLGLLTSVGSAHADRWEPLRADTTIHNGLIAIAVGRHIHNQCPSISARVLRALAFAESLVGHAQGMGFSRSEVNAYIDDPDEQQRYREIATRYFAERGVDFGDSQGICQVGRDEITAGSTIGRLLRES